MKTFHRTTSTAVMFVVILAALNTRSARAQSASAVAVPPRAEGARTIPLGRSLPGAASPNLGILLGSIDEDALRREDERTRPGGPQRCGIFRPFSSTGAEAGGWYLLDDDTWLWVLTIRSNGAKGVRLHLRETAAPLAGRVLIYGPGRDAEVLDPIELTGVDPGVGLYAATLDGDTACVECWVPIASDRPPLDLGFVVDGAVHQYRAATPAMSPDAGSSSGELPCNLDVSCFNAWTAEAQGVVRINWIDSIGHGWQCSASLLSRNPVDQTRLLLTAHHCDVSASSAPTLETTWFFQTVACNGQPNWLGVKKTVGAVLLRESPASDMRLLGLLPPVPGGATFLGWYAGFGWPNGNFGTVIHHPKGSLKKLSVILKQGEISSNCAGANVFQSIVPPGGGEIEKGSSGAPLFDAQHLVRGVVSCGSIPGCQSTDFADFGRLDYAFPYLGPFLTPVDPVFVDAAYAGPETGTASRPFNTFIEGFFSVIADHNLNVGAGHYPGGVVIDKAMTIRSVGGEVTIGG